MSSPSPSSPFRSDCLQGKVALVTGGGSGICYEITKQLLLHGCKGAVIVGRREAFLQRACANLQQFTPQCRVLYQVCDVRNAEMCKRVVEYTLYQFGGRLDILVNGAAGNFLAEAKALSPKGFKTVMEIDTLGTYHMSHAAHDALSKSSAANTNSTTLILNISATLHYGATWFQCHASAAKSAVDSLTRSWALEWGSDNIRVCGIAPGPIQDTPGTTKLAPGVDTSDVADMIQEQIPLQRMGTVHDIGMAAVFLSSDAGSYITGHTLVVDGGEWLYRPPLVPKEMVAELSRQVESKSRAQAPKEQQQVLKSKL